MEHAEDAMKKMIEESCLRSKKTMGKIKQPEKPFYGSYFIEIEIKSENAFNHFFEIFPSAPKIDFEHLNYIVNEFRLMYAFILGEDVV